MHRLQQQPLTEEAHQLLKRIIEEMKREDEAMAETLDPNYLKDLGIFERACCGYKFGPQSQRAATSHHHHHENHENHNHHNSRHDTLGNFAEEKETVVIAPKQQDRNRYGGCDKTEPELESERGWEREREWECESELESESESESESEYGSDEYLASDEEELDDEEGEQETDVHDTDIWDYGELDRAILGSMEEEEEEEGGGEEEEESLRLRVDDDDQADQIPNPTLEPQMKQDHKNQDPAVKWRNRMKTLVSNGDEKNDVLQVTKPFCGTTTHRVPKLSEESKEEPDDFMLKDRAESEKETEIEAEREETKVQEEHGASSIREIPGNSLPKASLSCCLPGRPVARFPRSHRRGSNQP